jgi:multidrug efflux pump
MVLGINIDFISRSVEIGGPSTQWWTQLATAIAGGLAFATLLTLVVTPALLLLGERAGERWARLRGRFGRGRQRQPA